MSVTQSIIDCRGDSSPLSRKAIPKSPMPSAAASTSARRDRAIASENIVSRAVLEAQGSVLTNKYAEDAGPALLQRLPVRRYCGDARHRTRHPAIRLRLRQRAARIRRLRQCRSVHSADTGDTFMGLNLAAGGHLTRLAVNLSAAGSKSLPYGVRREDHQIDMDEVLQLAK
jgi:glycine hydroxymethyltransferase